MKGVRNLLLVEDTEDDARLVLRALEGFDFELEISWAKDGHEALTTLGLAAESPSERYVPDLVICDVKMPKVGGPEVLQRIRSSDRLCTVPVVMFSTSTHHLDVDRCIQLGASDYCFKPFDIEEFAECVRGIVKRWLSPEGSEVQPECLVESSVEP